MRGDAPARARAHVWGTTTRYVIAVMPATTSAVTTEYRQYGPYMSLVDVPLFASLWSAMTVSVPMRYLWKGERGGRARA